uniref:assimilatory sulfite reductase (NADPH) n=1 Tax=Komagataella pastoris TaxID=4922 RepID=Q5EIV1_PICPA|nr:sulfite reductase alpha subunit [Komagataella pastoris]
MPSISQRGSRNNSFSSETTVPSLAEASAVSPFGLPTDPESLYGTTLTSAHTVITTVPYYLSDRLFSYAAPGADGALDAAAHLWRTYLRPNAQGNVPHLTRFDIRSGASNAILGYLSGLEPSAVVPVLVPGAALTYMRPVLAERRDSPVPVAFNVSALDYDFETSTLVSNYVEPLNAARYLGYSVFTPLSKNEAQSIAILTHALANIEPTLNLYDGPSYLKQSGKIEGILTGEKLFQLYQKLLAEIPSWSKIESYKRPAAALASLSKLTGSRLKSFEYAGHNSPSTVFVIHGSVESELLLHTVERFAEKDVQIGAIAARVPLPFNIDEFASSFPSSTRRIVVIGQVQSSSSSSLKKDVTASLFWKLGASAPAVAEFVYEPSFNWSSDSLESIIASYEVLPKSTSATKGDYIFWTADNGRFAEVASKIAYSFSLRDDNKLSYRAKFDNINGAGVLQAQLRTNSLVATDIDAADIVFVEGFKLLQAFDVVSTAKEGATLIIASSDSIEDLDKVVESFPTTFKRDAATKNLKILLIDLASVGEQEGLGARTGPIACQAIFYRVAQPELADQLTRYLWEGAASETELLASVVAEVISKVEEVGIKELSVDKEWASLPTGEEEEVILPPRPLETSFEPNLRESAIVPPPAISSKLELSKKLVFKESYGLTNSLRPDLPVRNFIVKVKENRRLTPDDYSRNIFHIEFDVSGTGLTYDIGEALGIHGRNDPALVEEFIQWYGLNGEDLIDVPSRDDPNTLETRTIFQSLVENIDLFGKPPKRFYEALAPFALDSSEKAKLEKLASPEGAPLLKAYQEDEFYSFADILELFPSAKPTASDLVQIVSPLKRREYSIASSQKMHPNEVHLLIVVVDWIDKRGRQRFGQCSHYLSELSVGSELVVSVKPSVMKLPPLSTQPIVMAGLGTGLAPFKAFVEEKIWQKQQGMEIGEVYLYLGARHRKEEYLYGELWEAYMDAGIVTHVGAAFSRDQPHKIYIQDRIRENLKELTSAIADKNGSFYLCGPTWPVPDITACLQDIIESDAARRGVKVDADHEIEEMKESGRYILEVY